MAVEKAKLFTLLGSYPNVMALKDGAVNIVNSMNVFEFNEDGKICHMDIYVQGKVEPSVPVEGVH